MAQSNITPENAEDLEFRISKFDYNQYQIDIDVAKGILRVAPIPLKIFKIKETFNNEPKFIMQSVNITSFVNKGGHGIPNNITQEDIENSHGIEITDSLDVIYEPYNIYMTTNIKPAFSIRAKSTVIKAEIFHDRLDYYGNPFFKIQISTAISYALAKEPFR